MLDIKFVRSNPQIVKEALEKGASINLDEFLNWTNKRKTS